MVVTTCDVVPFESLALAEQGLAAADFAVTSQSRPNLGHGIDLEGLEHGGAFLKAAFAG